MCRGGGKDTFRCVCLEQVKESKERRREREKVGEIKISFGSTCGTFSSVFHLRRWLADIIYEVSHNDCEMCFPHRLYFAAGTNRSSIEPTKIKLWI